MKNITVRKAIPKDIAEIKLMMKQLFLTWDRIDEMDKIDGSWFGSKESDGYLALRMKNEDALFLVAEVDGELAGFGHAIVERRPYCKDKDVGLIDELYVKPEYRMTGSGKAIKDEMIRWFGSRKIRWSIVLTHSQDEPANDFWKHVGYKDYNRKYRMRI